MIVSSLLIYSLFPFTRLLYFPINIVGMIFILFGIILNAKTDRLYKKYHTTIKPNETPTKLITEGAFKFSRNPMYLGMIMLLIGVSVVLGSLISLLFPLTFITYLQIFVIPTEEKKLELSFGNEYLKFKTKTRKWI